MERFILDDNPVKLELEQVTAHLKMRDDPKRRQRLLDIIEQAEAIAKPKAVYRMAFVDKIEDDEVTIDGVQFHSRVMSSNLKGIGRVFAYSATCGTEIEEWSTGFTNIMEKFWLNGIKELVLFQGFQAMKEHMARVFEVGNTASMNPGSLPDWPITQQAPLLSLLGDVREAIGVTLTRTSLLVPVKSISGLLFPNDSGYENCKLCTKKECSGRRAPFDPELYKEKLG